ncbi:protein HOTHEAD [Argentina anserina]|uniref:protein HOTHEAD n=1 Tax=Argentina anserina TaxID=57926 RepID=UPI0021768FEA|nr:protein HOTHEAD [Potentilla anserina]
MDFRWWRRSFSGALLSWIFFFVRFSSSDKAPDFTFVNDATSAPPQIFYDYIIVGGGTAGCPLAATLSHGGATVLVLERGGSPYTDPNITDIGNFASVLLDKSPTSPAQPFTSEDGVYNARARILGGGSAVNAGFYSRASTHYIKEAGWNQKLVEQAYEWVEQVVAFQPPLMEWETALRDGLLEVGVLPNNGFTFNHSYGTKVGGTIFDKEGHRHTAADLLEYADASSITVYLHAIVHKILFRHIPGRGRPQAYGVIYKDANGAMHQAYLNNDPKNEIILTAGAIGSPQLLMLSGIGPGYHLRTHGIPVVVDQPLVGQGMADNPMNILLIPSPLPVEVSLVQVVGITRFDTYIEGASGLSLVYPLARRLAKRFRLILNQGDYEPFKAVPEAMAIAADTVNAVVNQTLRAGVILEKITGPLSRGHLALRNLDPDDTPFVTFNYFKETEDLRKCIEGMRTIISVVNSKAFSRFRYKNMPIEALINLMLTLPINNRRRHANAMFSLEQFCIDTVMTIWHYHGGCQVGRVVDKEYRVLGVDSLRVVDGSTFHTTPGTNPQATVMMLGRYVGERIVHERYLSRKADEKN